jgi:hypothetical protein
MYCSFYLHNGVVFVPRMAKTEAGFPRPVMERHCGMKSLSTFERTATCWSISRDQNGYRICEWRRSERYRRAQEEANESQIKLPSDAKVEEVARRAAVFAMSST